MHYYQFYQLKMFAPVIVIVIASPQHKDTLCHAAMVQSLSLLHNGTSGNLCCTSTWLCSVLFFSDNKLLIGVSPSVCSPLFRTVMTLLFNNALNSAIIEGPSLLQDQFPYLSTDLRISYYWISQKQIKRGKTSNDINQNVCVCKYVAC